MNGYEGNKDDLQKRLRRVEGQVRGLQAMIERRLAEEDTDHSLSSADLDEIVEKTAGRSGVNMELIISTAARHADGLSVTLDNFLTALEEEESDFDKETAKKNQLFDSKHGWHPQ